MGYQRRTFVTDGIYHLIQRGHNRAFIFSEQIDKAAFLDIIKKTKASLPFHMLYYVLMDNHFHLIMQMQTASIGKVMHHINLGYSKYYNRKYHCSGAVYGQRFHARTVNTTSYLMQVILYIANNPVKAGLVKHPSEYRWCAHLEIISRNSGVVSTGRLFEIIGSNQKNGEQLYNDLIQRNINVSNAPTECAFFSERRSDQLSALLAEMIGERTSLDHICSGSRDALSAQIRRKFIPLAIDKGFKTGEIAKLLGVTDRCVRYLTPRQQLPNR